MTIYFYTKNQPYYKLSNFSAYVIEMNDVWWSTVEHYYQAMKYTDFEYIEKIRRSKTPKEAGILGRSRNQVIKENWESIKNDIMYEVVLKKFNTHIMLKDILIATGVAELAENSPFDYYWGTGADGSGINMLGKIFMRVRELLKQNEE